MDKLIEELIDKKKSIFTRPIILSWIPPSLWMYFIFYMSSLVADESNNLSLGVTERLIIFVNRIFSLNIGTIETLQSMVSYFNHYVRKYAHGTEYMLLGMLVINAFNVSGVEGKKRIWYTLGLCMLYAASDEIHQMLVPGRACRFTDWMIDNVGVLLGILGYILLKRIYCGKRVEDS